MQTNMQSVKDEVGTLAEHARALLAATGDVAGEAVVEARKRLAAALDEGEAMCGRARDRAVDGAKAAGEVVHQHPYQAIAIGVGFGALMGVLLTRGCSCNKR
jgi:ElaB/YqjD/DUF883 family membrane-anchored ribosome-binding protein